MSISVIMFFGVTAFSVLLFGFAPEAPSLVLLFSAISALVASFFGFEILVCGAVFVISFFSIYAALLIVCLAKEALKKEK